MIQNMKKNTKAAQVKRKRASVTAYRARMKREGFRLMQIWVPDVNAPGFAKEFARQTALAGKLDSETGAFLEAALADVLPGWEP